MAESGRSYVTNFGAGTKSFEAGIDRMTESLRKLQKEYKNNTKEQKAASKEIKDAEKELALLEKEIQKNGKATEGQKKRQEELNDVIREAKKKLDDLKIAQAGLKNEIDSTKKKIEEQKNAMEKFKTSMDDAKTHAKDLGSELAGLAAAGTAAVAGMVSYGRQAAQWADSMNTLSKTTGISTSELQKFEYATQLIDVSMDTLSGSLTKLTKNMAASAENGTGAAAESFDKLNVSILDSSGQLKDREEVFYDVIEALGKVGNETERDALAMEIFGKSAQQLNPLIMGGADALKAIGDEAEKAGLILSQDQLDGLNKFNDEIDSLISKSNSLQRLTASQMTPAVEGLLEVADDLLDEVNAMAQSGELETVMKSWGVTIRKGAEDLKNLVMWVVKHKEAVAGAAGALAGYKIGLSIGSLINSLCSAVSALKMATDKETASQIALNTAMNSNPVGVVIGLFGALTTGLTAYSIAARNSADATEKVNEALKTASEASAASAASAESEVIYIQSLGAEYEKLRVKADLTSEEKNRLASIADTLQSKLGLEADEVKNTAGEYQSLADKIKETVEMMKLEAQMEAAKAGLTSAYETQLKAEEAYRMKLQEVREKYPDLYDEKGNLNRNEYNYDTKDVVEEVTALKNAAIDAAKAVDYYSGKIDEAVTYTENAKAATNSSGAALDGVKGKIEEVGDAVDDVQAYADKMLNGEEGYDLKGFYELFRDTGEAADYLQERLTNANKALEDNRTEIKNTQDEIERLRKELNKPDITDEDAIIKGQQLEEAKEKLAQLRTEQVGLKEDVKSAQAEYKTAAWDAQTLSEKLSDIAKQSASVRSEMNSLANTYKSLSDGQQLSIDALLQLAEKYPEYAADIINANGSLEAQKEIVEKLFNLKKDELRLTLESARDAVQEENNKREKLMDKLRDQIRTYENYLRVLKNLKLTSMDSYKTLITLTGNAKDQLAELNGEFNNGTDKIDAYNKAIESLKNFGVNNYGGNDNTNNNYNPTQTSAGNDSVQWTWGWMDEIGTGDTSAAARLSLVERVHQIGKINDNELKAEYEKILRQEQLTADESYSIRLKLKNLTDKLADAQLQKQNENAKKAQEYALAAYTKLINGQVEKLNDLNDAIKAGADRQVKEIDEQLEKRRQKQEDDSRKKELDAINLQLKYMHDDNETSRLSLEQRRQEILNEQAEADYQRRMEQKKLDIQNKANDEIDKNTAAMKNLNTTLENFSYLLAKASGTLSTQQIINNNNVTQNFEAVRGSALTQKQAQQFLKAIVSL